MPVTIDRRQRQAIYDVLLGELTGVGDVYLALAEPDADYARQLRTRFEQDMRLLDDLDWEPTAARERYTLTAPDPELSQTLRRLHERAGEQLAACLRGRDEAATEAQDTLGALAALGDALAQLATTTAAAPAIDAPA